MVSPPSDFFDRGRELLNSTEGVPLPSNSRCGQTFVLADLNDSTRFTDAGPVLFIGPGDTRAIACPLDSLSRPGGALGYLDAQGAVNPGRADVTIDVPGVGGNYLAAHSWPSRYGGPGSILQFLIAEFSENTLGPMRVYEAELARVVLGKADVPAQNVYYSKIPLYTDDNAIADYILLQAFGDLGWNLAPTYVQNF